MALNCYKPGFKKYKQLYFIHALTPERCYNNAWTISEGQSVREFWKDASAIYQTQFIVQTFTTESSLNKWRAGLK